jgi:hypothetical protein
MKMKIKVFLMAALVLVSIGSANAATFYAASTGSNTAPYDTPAKAATSLQTAINAMTSDGDVLVISDETWTLTGGLNTTNMASTVDGATFTIQSAGNDPTACIIDFNSATGRLSFNESTYEYNFLVKGIGFKNSVTSTIDGAFCWLLNNTGDVTFENCDINGFTINLGETASTGGALIRNSTLASGTRILSFTGGTKIDNITMPASNSITMLGTDVDTKLVMNNAELGSISLAIDDDSSSYGLFYCRYQVDLSDVTITGPIVLSNPAASSGGNRPIFYGASTTDAFTVNGITATGSSTQYVITQTGGAISGALFRFDGPFTVNNLTASYLSSTEDTTNGLGGVLVAYGNTGSGTFSDSVVSYVTAQHGTAVYASQGGSITINRLYAHDNTAVGRAGTEAGGGGAVYLGGWGDSAVYNSLFVNNTADEGGAIYAHIQSAATRNKTTTIVNCTLSGNTATGDESGRGGNGILAVGADDTYTHTMNIYNTIGWDSETDEVSGVEAGAGLTLLIDHSDIYGGAASVTGEDTYTNNVAVDPQFSASYLPATGSLLYGGGFVVDYHNTVNGQLGYNKNPIMPWKIPIGAVGYQWGSSAVRSGE